MGDEPGFGEWSLRPGDVAKAFGVEVESVAEWSDRGWLPSRRTAGGHRRYRSEDVHGLLDRASIVMSEPRR